jgi:flagellar basal-body rod protein FlgF
MLRGLYTSASGMNAELLRQDVVANNIANANTTGFKKDDAVFEAFPERLLQRIHDRMDENKGLGAVAALQPGQSHFIGTLGQGVKADGTPTHFSDGSPIRSDRPLDLALQGNGLFTVQRADGSTAYTRNGSFTLNADHQLCTLSGDLVVGSGGRPISLNGTSIVVDSQGDIKVDGADAGKLALAAYDPQRFQKLGESLYVKSDVDFEDVGDQAPVNGRVLQGFTEQSNVQVVEEMVRMIEVNRAYESNAKTITMQDETLNRLISDVGHPLA